MSTMYRDYKNNPIPVQLPLQETVLQCNTVQSIEEHLCELPCVVTIRNCSCGHPWVPAPRGVATKYTTGLGMPSTYRDPLVHR